MKFTQAPFTLFFVEDPAASADFYRKILESEPVEQSPTFALFALGGGAMLGLWSKHTAEPTPTGAPGSSEIALVSEDVDAIHADWVGNGVPILAAPEDLDFGRTFVALDPDGHRVRVFWPAEA